MATTSYTDAVAPAAPAPAALTSSSSAHDGPVGSPTPPPAHSTPAEHRRNRKSWTEEEKRAFWKQKKQEKKERKRAAAADRLQAQQQEWEGLSEAEKASRRAEAAELHERRRLAEAALVSHCEAQLANEQAPLLVFDLSFAWCMTVPDTKSTVSQVKFSYSSLRRAGFPFRPVISSLLGKEKGDTAHDAAAQGEVLQALHDFEGFRRFPPRVTQDEHWSELYPADRVVFLTADAPEVVTTIEPGTAYIIGAFVDHNQYKGLSYAAAQRHGVRAARLPIKESVELGNRCKVLTINHVVDVLIKYEALRAAGAADWAAAIEEALPTRRTQQETQGSRKRRRRTGDDASSDAPSHSGSDGDWQEADAAGLSS